MYKTRTVGNIKVIEYESPFDWSNKNPKTIADYMVGQLQNGKYTLQTIHNAVMDMLIINDLWRTKNVSKEADAISKAIFDSCSGVISESKKSAIRKNLSEELEVFYKSLSNVKEEDDTPIVSIQEENRPMTKGQLIFKEYEDGIEIPDLAKKHNVSTTRVRNIIKDHKSKINLF